jgi:hypothetical protein
LRPLLTFSTGTWQEALALAGALAACLGCAGHDLLARGP